MTDTNQQAKTSSELRIAVVDDAFAPPTRDSVRTELINSFCSAVEERELEEGLQAVGSDFLDPAVITDEQLSALYDQRAELLDLTDDLNALFFEYDKRRQDLEAIILGIEQFPNVKIERYSSLKDMQGCSEVQVVFLDYFLTDGPAESKEIARQIYNSHRAFLVLMSDHTNAQSEEESFRKSTKLLRGFFRYLPKSQLVDPDVVYRTLLFVPGNTSVCHAIHDLIDALDRTLGGDVREVEITEVEDPPVPGQAVGRFMSVLRNLPLQDYAILCELTLSDEGHPLGDYIKRLFGSHLVEQVFTTSTVTQSLKRLDGLRFTEFLPVAASPSDSLKELYAASLVEPVINPWGEHPWEDDNALEQSDDE